MKREILYRAKTSAGSAWIYGGDVVTLPDGKCAMLHLDDEQRVTVTIVQGETVGQYIGKLDKHGTKIFENDVVQVYYGDEPDGRPMTVEWNGDSFYPFTNGCGGCRTYASRAFKSYTFDPEYPFLKRYTIEVIGTIHDNPEPVGAA